MDNKNQIQEADSLLRDICSAMCDKELEFYDNIKPEINVVWRMQSKTKTRFCLNKKAAAVLAAVILFMLCTTVYATWPQLVMRMNRTGTMYGLMMENDMEFAEAPDTLTGLYNGYHVSRTGHNGLYSYVIDDGINSVYLSLGQGGDASILIPTENRTMEEIEELFIIRDSVMDITIEDLMSGKNVVWASSYGWWSFSGGGEMDSKMLLRIIQTNCA